MFFSLKEHSTKTLEIISSVLMKIILEKMDFGFGIEKAECDKVCSK